MVKTGYISFIAQSGGGYDDDGNPIEAVTVKSALIECNLMTVKKEYKTFIDGQYKQASYSVYVDQSKINALDPVIDINAIYSIELFDNNSNNLGVNQIQNIEHLNLSGCEKIVV